MSSDEAGRPKATASVFAKVLMTLAVMAVLILVVVGMFVHVYYGSQVGPPVDRLLRAHVERLAREMGDPPDEKQARMLAASSGFQVRFEGPGTVWSTTDDLPTIAEARRLLAAPTRFRPSLWNRYYLVQRAGGGTLLFRWDFGWAGGIHNEILITVVLLIVLLVAGAHIMIRHHLAPIRGLRQGVARLASGDFDVQVPVSGNDELAALAEAFNGMIRRLAEMMRARDQLLIDVSHELRSPITRMKLALEMLPDGDKKERLDGDLREMETMVVELLEIERIKDGRGGVSLAPGDLAGLVRDVVREQQDRPPGTHLAAAPDRVVVAMDRQRLRVAFKNILDNALKFSLPDSRPVEIRVEVRPDDVTVRVSDDGPGISEDDLPRVFDPFYRADPSRSKATGGYGLGLAMCKRIVEAHGGAIALVNNAGRGATAVVTLPAAVDSDAAARRVAGRRNR